MEQAIGSRLTSDWQAIDTNGKKQLIFSYIKERKNVSAAEISAVSGLSKPRARAILHEMATDGKIEQIGKNRYAYYVIKV